MTKLNSSTYVGFSFNRLCCWSSRASKKKSAGRGSGASEKSNGDSLRLHKDCRSHGNLVKHDKEILNKYT